MLVDFVIFVFIKQTFTEERFMQSNLPAPWNTAKATTTYSPCPLEQYLGRDKTYTQLTEGNSKAGYVKLQSKRRKVFRSLDMEEFILLEDSKISHGGSGMLPGLSLACLCLMSFLLPPSLTLIIFLRKLSHVFTGLEECLRETRIGLKQPVILKWL